MYRQLFPNFCNYISNKQLTSFLLFTFKHEVYFPELQGLQNTRSSPWKVFLSKDVLKICSKFTGGNSYSSAISLKLFFNFSTFIGVTLLHGLSRQIVQEYRGLHHPKHRHQILKRIVNFKFQKQHLDTTKRTREKLLFIWRCFHYYLFHTHERTCVQNFTLRTTMSLPHTDEHTHRHTHTYKYTHIEGFKKNLHGEQE